MQTAVTQGFRLSPQQQHLWRVQGTGHSAGLVAQCAVDIDGPLDHRRLRLALERCVERHEVLRTTFHLLPGMNLPVQVVAGTAVVPLREHDLSELAPEAWDEAVEGLLAADRETPFDLANGPLVRAALVGLGPDHHALLLSMPAVAADAASLRNLAAELATGYAGGEAGEEVLQYADAAEILHEWLDAAQEDPDSFWRRQDLAALARPGRPVGPAAAYHPGAVRDVLAGDRLAGLTRLGVPVSRLLLALWQATAFRSTGDGRVVVGAAFDGRTCDEFETALGPFGRILPIDADLDARTSLRELAAVLADRLAAAGEWQDGFPLEVVDGLLAADGRAPRWELGFDYHRLPPAREVGAVRFAVRTLCSGADRFDLRLSALQGEDWLRLDLAYDAAAVDRSEAERLLARFLRLLDSALAAPEAPLAELDALGEDERQDLLVEFNRTARAFAGEGLAHELFAAEARRRPDATAVVAGGLRLTYGELDARADRLARRLRGLGVGPESRVGLSLTRSPELVEAILAVLKAGGAYVPLDPSYPAERLAFMAEDAGLTVLLTMESLRSLALEEEAGDEALPAAGAENAAYVIYTSGSTGRPKGVVVPHRGLANYLLWAREAYRVGEGGGAPVHSPIGFDLTVTSLLAPLATGAAVTLLPEEPGVGTLAAALAGAPGYSLVKITPAHLEALRHVLPPAEHAGATAALVIGGEALWADTLALWREHAPATRLINEYGPTEATVGCCVYEVAPQDPGLGPVAIGRPIANTRLYVVGAGRQPVPAGAPGELWIGGGGLARGYLGRPDVTAERFVPDPFGDQPGARLYRTGDLVRHRADGNLEYLGRIDDQVKIRGFRIEPGEVEAVLASHPMVREAVVVARDGEGGKRLVAFTVPRGERPAASELRAFLGARLPEHMVPSAFVTLEALPLTANGKVDRRALPEPREADAEVLYVAPRTLEEDLLAEIWARVLGVDRIGIDTPFFSVGGDSIRSIQVLSLAQERGLNLTLQDFFQQPTIRSLAARSLAAGPGGAEPETTPFSLISDGDRRRLPQDVEDAYPLAQLQAGMLFHSEYTPGSAIYHDFHSFHLRGRYQPEMLQAAVDQVVRRHAALRTSFALSGYGEPLQLVHRGVAVAIESADLRQLPADEQEAAVAAWLEDERLRPYDWRRAPLVRFQVHRRSEDRFQFTLSFHHCVLDGWSAASLLSELFRRYTALLDGAPLPGEPPRASFAEFVRLERRALETAETREFWSRSLTESPFLRLPRRAGSGAAAIGHARDLSYPVSPEISDGLHRLAREAAVPLKSVLLAAHLKVSALLAGQDDVVAGVVTNGRPEREGGDEVAGLFLNSMPLRLRAAGGTWAELARAAFDREREAMPHRRFPLAEIQRLQGGRPLFESAFNFLHYHVYQGLSGIQGLEVLGRIGYEETNFPLTTHFQLDPASQRLILGHNFREDEIDVADIERIRRYTVRALAAMTADPAARHEDAVLLDETELAQLLGEWSQGDPGQPPVARVEELFAGQAALTPDAVALAAGDERITYGELDRRSNALARRLVELGVGPDAAVGLLLPRSAELIVGMLATLKAGGAYVPLDPTYPRERLAWMARDAGLAAVVGRGAMAELAPAAVDLDQEPLDNDGALPPAGAGLDGLAYVLYTSGSTGTPKGVAVPHRAIVRLVRGAAFAQLGPDEVLLHLAAPSFDAATLEVWGALLNGGRLVVAPPGALSLAEIGALVEGNGVTTLWLTAGLFQQMVDHQLEALRPLRRLLAGGDVLSPDHVRRALEGLPGCTLINGYGPTENTTFTCCHPMTGPEEAAAPVPIGRPIARTRVYLLDAGLRPVPAGTPGELLAGGDGLARGYHGRPELTAERFVPDPFATEPGGRLYRTGDLARFRPDGTVEFLGRLDQQVKIRGFRVEPGEVEDALVRHPGVREAAVLAAGGSGDRRLVAYVVPAAGETPTAAELRAFLKDRLPEAMMPSAFVALPALPLTPNGKLDRAALPSPDAPAQEAALTEGYAAPRSPMEELIADIWADLLERRPVGIHDDFFELGGHSLLATRVISWVRETLRIDLPLRTLFERPTLADFAAEVETALRAGQAAPLTAGPIERLPRPLPAAGLPLSFAQQRLWFLDQMVPGNPFYNIPASLWMNGRLDVPALTAALSEVVRRHEALRTTFRSIGGLPVQVVSPPAPLPLPLVDLTVLPVELREEETRRLAAEESQHPFDLARGPLVRASLARLEGERHALLMTVHHIVADGWSTGVLIRELSALYSAFAAGRPSPLPELEIQYPDFAAWQRSWLQGDVLADEVAYWKERLAEPPPLNLPVDRPRPPVSSFRGGVAVLQLPLALADALRALAQRQGATLYMTLLAGWKALLSRYTGQEDLLVGAPIANRNRAEIEGLIGFFVNTLALRTSLAGDPSFRELVERVRETTLGAYAHQDMPFEKLVEELHPERDTSRNPLFQVALLLQNFPTSELRLPGLSLRSIGEGNATAKFDLQIFMEETPGSLLALVEYSADLFDPPTVHRMLLHFQTLAEAAAADPGVRLARLPLLRREERQHLLLEWNDTVTPEPHRLGLHQMFEAQARRTPDAPAVSFEDRTLTYAELDREANRLAHRLQGLGCGPETRVGVAMERSIELVTALYGVLKAGAAYVPFDPEYPLDRLAFMLEDARPAVLLTQARLLPRLPAHDGPVLLLDEEDLGGESAEPLAGPVDDLQAAYMIYTSGSTGRPKGALVHHGAIRNRLVWMQDAYGLGPGDTVLQKTPFSFDVSVWELFWPLMTGARLAVARPGGHRDGGYLADLIGREGVTVLHFVPSMLQAFLEEPDLSRCGSIRLVVASGEALPPSLARRFRERLDARLENLYGPTEAAVDVTAWRSREGEEITVPIGRPIANTRIHLLDRSLEPAPAGVPGELYIAGANVGRGYLGRPALTAEKFVPDPFATVPGARMYRTGDLARHLADGPIEFLGRIDHQVKLRGFRIELGEIEAVLASHPAVRECVTMVREDVPGDPRLVAYVVEGHAEAGETENATHVSQWRDLYDDTYAQAAELPDPSLNLVGWNSSYTGEAIPEAEMREWVETTVGRILALRPRRVLELGCGTGLLLFRVAPACESYVGADFSRAALDFVAPHLAGLPQVELQQRTADDFSGFEPGSFDLVILNSVVQYFPGIDYLVRVLEGAARVLAPGGAIFVGDVRSLPLQRSLAASVELAAAPGGMAVSELRQRIQRRLLHEEEMLIAPGFFRALAARVPGIAEARIEVKQAVHRNELTAFRYDATLRTGAADESAISPVWRAWDEDRLSLQSLRDLLIEERPDALGVSEVPNARVRRDAAASALLESGDSPATVAELREALAGIPEGIDPEALRRLGAELGYAVEVSWAGTGEDGSLEAVFHLPGIAVRPRSEESPRVWRAYANDPLAGKFARTLMPELRSWAQERLPEYAVPSAFVLLPAFPLSPNGKVDRKVLPAPERPRIDTAYAKPRDPAEELLAGIWEQILGVERVGIHDNFFDLGGHSLLATQVVSRVRGALHVELSVRQLFERPTVAELAAWIRSAGTQAEAAPPVVPVPRDGDLPLSFAQQRLWFLYQLDPESPVYNMPFTFRLSGPLQAPALARALDGVVARHETLRTTFVVRDGVPSQRIAPPAPEPLPVIDLSHLPPAVREATAQGIAAGEAQIPFDLSRPPVVRARLLRLAADDHVLLFTIHHISGDGWSVDVLQGELVELYEAALDGRDPRLPELPVQYADFAVWQRAWLEGEVFEAQLAYWRRQLAGAPALLELATDHPRPPVQTYRGARESRRVSAELARALDALGRREGATPFMVTLAGYLTLLHRATGQETIVVGTPIANRERPEVEGLIGFFANTLALRVDLGGGLTFRRLLARVREAALGAYAHQDLPFERLVDELQPQRDMSHSPVFQALFVHQSAPVQALRVRDLALRPFNAETGVARFDLTLAVSERADGLLCNLDYNSDLFEPATAARLLGLFTNLMAAAKEGLDLDVADLPWLDAEERSQVLALAEGTDPGVETVPLHRLFERHAARTPDAIAVVSDDERVTYAQLDRRAGTLARRLRAAGAGPESRVALCMSRSADAIAAMLAVLKTGGAYVPLDPESPRDRLAAILADAGAEVLLTQEWLAGELAGVAPRVLTVEAPADADAAFVSAEPLADQAAYVIYTSGSTGVPKGVVATHRGVSHFVQGFAATIGMGPEDRLLLFAPLSFDASVLQIFPALASGGGVVLHPNPRELATVEILEICDRHGITVLDLPAALWRQWVEDVAARGLTLPAGVRLYLTGGESVPVARLRTWAALAGRPAAFLSSYGPTEATVTATVFQTTSGRADELSWANVPIGGPLPATRVYVLDRGLRLVPRGVPGELYLGGPGLARGYLGRPEQTAGAFLPDPHSGLAGERLYRTGDLARYLPDGNLEFLGRADHQVKIRGFRLELAEVEAALARHAGVREAVVLLREDSPGDKRLAAYVTPSAEGGTLVPGELRSFLAERLPQYMVPSSFTVMETLPVLPSGKVDRAALPAPEPGGPEAEGEYQAPRTPEERILAEVWAEVLRARRVGVHDNFFALGGDSILSIQIIARANQRGLHLTPKQLFEHQTVAELARVARTSPALRAEQGPVSGPVPLTPIQRWFFAEGFADPHHFNHAVMLEAAGPVEPRALTRTASALAAHHDALRLRFTAEEGEWRQINAESEPVPPLLWIDLAGLPADRRAAAVEAAAGELNTVFGLERGPLAFLSYFDLGPEHNGRLLWVAHHLVVDGVSWRVLLEDLDTAYRQAAAGEEPALPLKTTSFRAWSERLHEHARSGALSGEMEHWLAVARTATPRLPVDFPAGTGRNTVGSVQSVSFALTPEETQKLLQEIPAKYRTQINDALLAALALALSGWTGSTALRVDLEGHGREPLFDDVDLSRTVGWFTTQFPVVVDPGETGDAGLALAAVKEQLRRVPGRGIGYGLLRWAAGDAEAARTLREAPGAEVSFNYLGQLDGTAGAGGARFRPAPERPGALRSPRSHRTHLLEVSGMVAGGQLRMTLEYSPNLHRRATIERLAEAYAEALRALSSGSAKAVLTAGDFKLAKLNEKTFRKLSALLDKAE